MHKLQLVILVFLFSSCSNLSHRTTYLTDDDIVINDRLYSPDSAYIVYDFVFDIGALGYSRSSSSIVAISDTLGDIGKTILPNYKLFYNLTPDKWLDSRTLIATVRMESLIRDNVNFKSSTIKVGDIKVQIEQNDPTRGNTAIIEHIAPSFDYKRLLVVYSYDSPPPADISVIDFDGVLPILGNVYIEDVIETPILYGCWLDNKTIELQIKKKDDLYGAELNKKLNVKVKKRDVEYKEAYSGIVGGWYNKRLYPTDTTFNNELTHFSKRTTAIVSDIFAWGDSYYTKKSNFFYIYTVDGKEYKSYFRANEDSLHIEIGDKIEMIYSSRQPIIHKLLKNNFR